MNSEFYLEFASRSGEFLFRQRLPSLPVTIGRSLQNDLVVDDPYVAASHLEIGPDPEAPGELLIRDLGSRNGLFLDRARVRQARLRPGQVLHFGHTTLRLRHPAEAIEPERADVFASQVFSLSSGLIAVALIVLVALIQKPLDQFTEISAKAWMLGVLWPVGMVAAWAAIWAMLTRLFAGHSQFGAHLAIAAWCLLGIEALTQALSLAAFAFSTGWLGQLATPAGILLAAWALYRQLALAQLRWARANLPLAMLLTALPASLWMMSNWEARHSLLGESIVTTLYLPGARIAPGVDSETFIKRIGALQAAIDAQTVGDEDEEAETDNILEGE